MFTDEPTYPVALQYYDQLGDMLHAIERAQTATAEAIESIKSVPLLPATHLQELERTQRQLEASWTRTVERQRRIKASAFAHLEEGK